MPRSGKAAADKGARRNTKPRGVHPISDCCADPEVCCLHDGSVRVDGCIVGQAGQAMAPRSFAELVAGCYTPRYA